VRSGRQEMRRVRPSRLIASSAPLRHVERPLGANSPTCDGASAAPRAWGLVFPGAHRHGTQGINVRVESVARAPASRESLRKRRRCLVIVDRFFEWQRRDKAKQPFFVRRDDGRPFALAGIWDRSTAPDGEPIDSCVTYPVSTLVNSPANDDPRCVEPVCGGGGAEGNVVTFLSSDGRARGAPRKRGPIGFSFARIASHDC
jgi:putative SOS response-associated peptidase YedK